MARQPNEIVAIQVRMPERLRVKLAVAAAKNRRSLNAEILWQLDHTEETLAEAIDSLLEPKAPRARPEPLPTRLEVGDHAARAQQPITSEIKDWQEFLIQAGPEFIEMLAQLVAEKLKRETKE
jgi:hypothetical protein